MEVVDCVYLFVYGTLMNCRSNHRLLAGARYIGKAVLEGFGMYKVSSFPGIIRKPGSMVIGEVYKINEDTLNKVDILEGEGFLYNREVVTVFVEGKETIKAFTYVWNGRVNSDAFILAQDQPWKGN